MWALFKGSKGFLEKLEYALNLLIRGGGGGGVRNHIPRTSASIMASMNLLMFRLHWTGSSIVRRCSPLMSMSNIVDKHNGFARCVCCLFQDRPNLITKCPTRGSIVLGHDLIFGLLEIKCV